MVGVIRFLFLMNTIPKVVALWCCLAVSVAAQTTDNKAAEGGVNKVLEASRLRGDLVNSIVRGEQDPATALNRLRQHPKVLGVKADVEADFAVGAVEIGHRLAALRKGKESIAFFRAAEASLSSLIARAGKGASHDLVQYLQIRASIRANNLNMPNEARADLDEAIKLAPDDKFLVQQRRLITADPAAMFRSQKELPAQR